MKKKECPSCAMEVDSKSRVCPVCGYEFTDNRQSGTLKWIALLLALILLFYLIIL